MAVISGYVGLWHRWVIGANERLSLLATLSYGQFNGVSRTEIASLVWPAPSRLPNVALRVTCVCLLHAIVAYVRPSPSVE